MNEDVFVVLLVETLRLYHDIEDPPNAFLTFQHLIESYCFLAQDFLLGLIQTPN